MSEHEGSRAASPAPLETHGRSDEAGSRPRGLGWLWLLLPLVVAVAYAPGVSNDYVVWDDDIYIRDNPFLLSVGGLVRIWMPIDPGRKYYPITYTTHWFEHQLWGRRATGYYVVNVALHALNAVLVFALLRALGASNGVALLAAGLFAAHPMQAASVAWLAARKTLLSTTLALLGCLCYWRYRLRQQGGWSYLALALFTAALLSKTATVTFIGLIVLADWLLLRRRLWDALVRFLPLLIVVAAGLIYIDSRFEKSAAAIFAEPWPLRPLAASAAFWFYTGKLLWPAGLALIYPKWTVTVSAIWVLPLVCLVATAIFVWLVRRRIGALVLWGAAYFFVTLLPILGLLSFGYLKHSPVGDQYVYPAALGIFLVVGLAVERLARWIGWRKARFLLVPAGVAAVVGLGWLTWVRVPQWRGPVEFWSHTIDRYPEFRFGRRRLADAYEIRGRLSEAADQYTRLLQDDPADVQVHNNLGAALDALGRPAEALKHYRIAAERAAENDLAEVQPNLAACLRKLGLLSAEITRLRTALAREPEDAETRYALAAALGADGLIAEAIRHARQLVRDHPDDPHLLYRVAFLLRELRQDAAAAEAYRLAARQARAQNLAQLWYKINRELAGPTGAAAGD